ncbi:flagellar assembly protein FliH [Borrelia anserina]|uniref:Flagellar assembly protein FliH n=2 Tax=Borrelia anserina TaxID=143 RepID=W5SM59_BORAN|nr:flagellar assembly protein FliH [Borrelia anserina]AHH08254.1 Flagellar assembly protein fliH [Borrelia anserina BA2]APR64775.1 flagellar assembly protein FliH [Borrelia anserina Es]UPA06690.1 flagellar assembly protein FliH [Borrelia anserina]
MPRVLYKSKEVVNVAKLEFVEIANPIFKSLEIKKKESEISDIDSRSLKLRNELEDLENQRAKLREAIEHERELAKKEIDTECSKLLEEAKEQANKIVNLASERAEFLQKEAEDKKEAIERESNLKIEQIVKEHEERLKREFEIELERGRNEGYDAGFKRGCEDFDQVLGKLNNMVSSLVAKRKEILESSGEHIMNLVMQIAVKVVKKIIDSQKGVVIENVNEALKKIKSKTNIVIRVNLDDIDIVNHQKHEFISKFDFIDNLEVIEDINVGKGGCVIETDFGEIDARISSQLDRIEEKFKNLSSIF